MRLAGQAGRVLALLALAIIPLGCSDDGTGPGSGFEPRAVEVATGPQSTCARLAGGEVRCWGQPIEGSANPPGETSPIPYSAASGALQLAMVNGIWDGTACWVARDGAPWCQGFYSTGTDQYTAYGPGPRELEDTLPLHGLSLGEGYGCALDPDGHALCWGSRVFGKRGGEPPPPAGPWSDLELNIAAPGLTFAQLVAGQAHTCGRTPGGEVHCWGFYQYLGDSSGTVTDDPDVCWWAPCSYEPVLLRGVSQAVDLAGSGYQTCALLATGQLRCWTPLDVTDWTPALPPSGRPETVTLPITPADIEISENHACALNAVGAAWCWGRRGPWLGNPSEEPGVLAVETDLRFTALSLGRYHTCGVTAARELWCWGENVFGQLGNGTTEYSAVPVRVRFEN